MTKDLVTIGRAVMLVRESLFFLMRLGESTLSFIKFSNSVFIIKWLVVSMSVVFVSQTQVFIEIYRLAFEKLPFVFIVLLDYFPLFSSRSAIRNT